MRRLCCQVCVVRKGEGDARRFFLQRTEQTDERVPQQAHEQGQLRAVQDGARVGAAPCGSGREIVRIKRVAQTFCVLPTGMAERKVHKIIGQITDRSSIPT